MGKIKGRMRERGVWGEGRGGKGVKGERCEGVRGGVEKGEEKWNECRGKEGEGGS